MATKSADQIAAVLKEIQSRIPKTLLKNAVREVKMTPTVDFVMQKALESPTISEEKKQKIRDVIASGEFTKMKYVDDPKIQKMINNFLGREINKAIKEGKLPPQNEIKEVDFIKSMYEKMKTK